MWLPRVADLLESVIAIGASPSIVPTVQDHHPELDSTRFESLDCSGEEQFVDARSTRKLLHRRCFAVQNIVQFFTVCVQTKTLSYNFEELRGLFVVACHLSVEKLFQVVSFDVRVFIASILEAYTDETWEQQVRVLD